MHSSATLLVLSLLFVGSFSIPAIAPTNCASDSDCEGKEFCAYNYNGCDSSAGGYCTAIPDACTLQFAPACGCDGLTYGNPCGVTSAGISIFSDQACSDEPGTGAYNTLADKGSNSLIKNDEIKFKSNSNDNNGAPLASLAAAVAGFAVLMM